LAAHEEFSAARPQTAEVVKTFGERCPQVVTNNIQTNADYVVVLDHEGGKGLLRHKNKVAVFTRATGDSVVSKSTTRFPCGCEELQQSCRSWSETHARKGTHRGNSAEGLL
jgi:hypothetical protein